MGRKGTPSHFLLLLLFAPRLEGMPLVRDCIIVEPGKNTHPSLLPVLPFLQLLLLLPAVLRQ